MPNYLNSSTNVLQPDVWMGPATVVMADLADTESLLRSHDTLAWKKGWSERSYDFPNNYVNLPLRVVDFDPVSTYADDQNTRFSQRYLTK